MDTIIHKLSEIETSACAIVEHAEAQKEILDKEMKKKTDDFDRRLAEDTQKKSDALQKTLETEMATQLSLLRTENETMIRSLKKEYKTKHELYAQEILKRITEV